MAPCISILLFTALTYDENKSNEQQKRFVLTPNHTPTFGECNNNNFNVLNAFSRVSFLLDDTPLLLQGNVATALKVKVHLIMIYICI